MRSSTQSASTTSAIFAKNTQFVSAFAGYAASSASPDSSVDAEAEPHHAIDALQIEGRHRSSCEQPEVEADVDAGEHREAERVQIQDERERQQRRRFAYPDAERVLLEAREQHHHVGSSGTQDFARTACACGCRAKATPRRPVSSATSMSAGRAAASSCSSARCSSRGCSDTPRRDAEALGESNEVGVLRAASRSIRPPNCVCLIAQHVRERMVVEDDRNERDPVLRSRRELLHAEHEAAVTGHRHHGFVGIGHFGAERRRKTEAECALEPFRDIGARRQDREGARVGREADLR